MNINKYLTFRHFIHILPCKKNEFHKMWTNSDTSISCDDEEKNLLSFKTTKDLLGLIKVFQIIFK